MTANEKFLFKVLISCTLSVSFIMYSFIRISALHESESRVAYYEKTISILSKQQDNLDLLEKKLLELQETDANKRDKTNNEKNISLLIDYLRSALKKEGIIPERYTITGKETNRIIEFSFHAKPIQFFRFLKGYMERNMYNDIIYISMKELNGQSAYNIIIRVLYEN